MFQSNTLIAEMGLGWKGLLIEPALSLQKLCKCNRPKVGVHVLYALQYYATHPRPRHTPPTLPLARMHFTNY